MSPELSFVIPVRNDAEHLRRCLESIRLATEGVATEVIVIDNGSSDHSRHVAMEAGAIVLDMPGKRVAELRNHGASHARGELLAFVDADHELAPGWAAAGIAALRDRAVTGAGAQYHAPIGGTWVQRTYDRLRRHRPGQRDVDWLPSGNLVVRRKAFEQSGGYDTTLETCEDVELCQRLTKLGRLVATDRMGSVHQGDPKTLRALFFGELWRGRDNLRVSLRVPLTLRSLPGVLFPLVHLSALAAVVIGLLGISSGGIALLVGGVTAISTLTVLRAAMLVSGSAGTDRGPVVTIQVLSVAAVYDIARALALVLRMNHLVRRKA